MKDYEVLKFNINDSVGDFTYKVRLSNHIDYEPETGFLYCKDAILGNVGVQIYKGYELGFANRNEIVKVHRKAEDIFDQKSLESLRGKPITLEHPSVLVDSNNVKQYAKGTILDIGRPEGDNIVCDLVIHDKELIDLVAPVNENGEREISDEFRDLSLGYKAKLVPLDDTNEYVQKDIEYNHLAVVREGRAMNAMIRDSKIKEIKERKHMNFFNLFKGKKIRINDDDTLTLMDEEEVVSKTEVTEKHQHIDPFDKDKKVTVERKTEEIVKEENAEEAKIEEEKEEKKETKKTVKDKAYFTKAFNDAQMLPDGPFKEDTIAELNKEYREAFPKATVKDSVEDEPAKIKVQDSKEIDELAKKQFEDQKNKGPKVDFEFMDKESKLYYDKLTNPESGQHKDHDEWQAFYNSEVRKGKTNLNL